MKKNNKDQISLFDIELQPESAVRDTQEVQQETYRKINPAQVPDEEYESNNFSVKVQKVDEILKKIGNLAYKASVHELLSDIFEMGAIAISNQVDFKRAEDREKKYLTIINKYDKKMRFAIQEIFGDIYGLLSNMVNPHVGFNDYLGELYMKSETSSSKSGQFFTPYSVSKMCAQCDINESVVREHMEKDEILTLNEPTCGSGGMILAAADVLYNEYHFNTARNLLVSCGDIDARCVHMSYLQLSLAGIPAVILHQNALSLETWDRWETPAYIFQWTRFKNIFKGTTAE